MRSLVVTAHPSTQGFTHKVAQTYAEAARATGKEVNVLDLYAPENRQDFVRFEKPREFAPDANRDRFHKMILAADEIVFVHPLWWGSAPAILKNFFDSNFGGGFAFRFKKGPFGLGIPVGLLAPRTAKLYITCDGPWWYYALLGMPFVGWWKRLLLGFVGIRTTRWRVFADKRNSTPEKMEKWLGMVRGDAAR
jgi:putative NADPH-quinone reductase